MFLTSRRFWITLLPLVTVGVILSWYWSDIMLSIVTYQQSLHERLADHIKQVNAQPWTVGGSLMLLSLFYGIFHAAGPGHGKAVLVTYLATQKENIRQAVGIAIAAALLQAVVAIGLISFVALLLEWSFRDTQQLGVQVQLASYGLVILLGLSIGFGALKQFWQNRGAHDHCHHAPALSNRLGMRQAITLVTSMGIRPCSGALLVLIYAHLVGVYAFGIASTFIMAVGTALTVSLIAVVSVVMRDRLKASMREDDHHHHDHGHLPDHSHWIRFAGAIVLVVLGTSLLVSGWTVNQSHPLF